MSHLTDVIEEENARARAAFDTVDIEAGQEIIDFNNTLEKVVTQAMTKAALAVIEEIKKNSEEAVPRLWYVSESTFETLKAILITPKE